MNLRRLGRMGAIAALLGGAARAELPAYQPGEPVHGVIRVWGSDAAGVMLAGWERGFRHFQPGVCFEDTLKGSATGIMGLTENVADLALMGRRMYTYEAYGVYRRSLRLPVAIAVANGAVAAPRRSSALAVFVRRDNPLTGLTLAQLDGIFGAERTGGWQGLKWNRTVARGPESNLRRWGQVGLTGEWRDRPIHVYGPPALFPGGQSFFQSRVMGGADTRAEDWREYEDPRAMVAALARDQVGIGYGPLYAATDQVKAIALSAGGGAPFVPLGRSTVISGEYPLARQIYLYFTPDLPTGELRQPAVDPKVREFLRYILSREGQAVVAAQGDYLPLSGRDAGRQRQQLFSP